MGKLIALADRKLLGVIPADRQDPYTRDKAHEKRMGQVLVVIVLVVVFITSASVMLAAYRVSRILFVAAEAVFTCYVLAHTSLRRESIKVYAELKKGSVENARKALSMIVGRDTDSLDEAGITRAAVETVAENFSDGVIAPMLYTAAGGPVLGLLYKAVNTMDSMIGYRNDRYMWFGAAAASLDDAVNYVPSRLSAMLLVAASAVLGKDYDAISAWRIFRRDRYKHKSPNAAQTESAAAGALGLRLAGDAYYFGKPVSKPHIGDEKRIIEPLDIVRMNRLMSTATFMGEFLCLAAMAVISAVM